MIAHPTDLQLGQAGTQIVRCPDCGQMEIWTEEETNDHGHCRATPSPCWCEGLWLTTQEVAHILDLEESTVRKFARAGRFDGAVHFGRHSWMIPTDSIAGVTKHATQGWKRGRPRKPKLAQNEEELAVVERMRSIQAEALHLHDKD